MGKFVGHHQIYCISLKRRPDRRNTARKNLKSLSYKFFDAVDGQIITTKYMKKNNFGVYKKWKTLKSSNPYHRRDLKTGEIGCSLSHFFLWKDIAKRNLDYGIILEDDAKLAKNFSSKFKETLKKLEKKEIKWDFIYLGRVIGKGKERKVTPGIRIPKFSYTTVGYALSKTGAEKLLQTNFSSKIIPVDEFLPAMYCNHPRDDVRKLFPFKKLKAFAIEPSIVDQYTNDSDTEKSESSQGKFGDSSVIQVSKDITVRWSDGNILITPATGKGYEVKAPAKDYGLNFSLLLNGFAKPTSFSQFLKKWGKLGKSKDFKELTQMLISMDALQVLTW